MTIKYMNIYPDSEGFLYEFEHDAKLAASDRALHVALPVEIPDPPHEWKVGDWFKLNNGPRRIADIVDGRYSCYGRSNSTAGALVAWVGPMSDLDVATPCDPPDWWEGDR